MQNPVYSMVSEALARVVSERAADNMLRAALRESSLIPEQVTASEMQHVLIGPLKRRLSTLMPPGLAHQELSALAAELQARYPKAPTLFDETPSVIRPAAAATGPASTGTSAAPDGAGLRWDTSAFDLAPPAQVPAIQTAHAASVGPTAGSTASGSGASGSGASAPLDAFGGSFEIELEEFDIDEFEFDDPEDPTRVTIPPRFYDLRSVGGQDTLLSDLARFDGVQGVVLCDEHGQVVRSRLARGAESLGTVMAATSRALGQRPWRILCADLGTQTVYVRPLGRHVVALLTASNTNVGRLIGELSVVKESA